jgi:hypothetical protein
MKEVRDAATCESFFPIEVVLQMVPGSWAARAVALWVWTDATLEIIMGP